MEITGLQSEGILSIECRINGGLTEEDVARINVLPNESVIISDRFSTSPELVAAEDQGLISTTTYETDDLSAMNKEKTIEVLTRDITYLVDITNAKLDVALQDQTTENINLRFVNFLNSFTLASDTSIDDKNITLVTGHGYQVGNSACIKENDRYYQGIATAVNGNTITLDSPLDYAYTTLATCSRTSHDLNVDGSVTPVIFRVSPLYLDSDVSWDITRTIFHMEGDSAMDGGLFGDLDALDNGIILRYKDSLYKNILNAKTNGDLLDFCNSGDYDDRASNKGVYGFRCIKVFGGQQNDGVVIRLSASTNDELQVIVQDDLTDLNDFHVSAIGHKVD